MKTKEILIHCSILTILLNSFAYGQADSIGLSWAKNSVNGTIFRKNSVTSFNGNQFVSYYDSSGYVVLAKRSLDSNKWKINTTQHSGDIEDAHNVISIGVDGNGYVHMAWDHHGHPLRYSMSTDSLGITMGEKQSMIGTLESVVTYPEFFRLPDGDLLFIYRDGWSGNANCVINKYSIKDKEWVRLHDNLISGQSTRSAYWQSCVDSNGVIHVSWVWRESSDVSSNHDMCYARSSDGGVTWCKSTGEQYTIPIKASTAEKICTIPQNSELINQTSIFANSDSRPYIASYWTEENTGKPQYQIIYLDKDSNWQLKTFSNRASTFSLSGSGTKKIPISRPQVLVNNSGEKSIVYMIYRDSERDSKVSINVCSDIEKDTIQILEYDITDFSVDDWEPSYDIDLWKDSLKLDVFVQRMQQGDGETLSDLEAQPVYIWHVEDLENPDTIFTPATIEGRAINPTPESGTENISVDTSLSWTSGNNATSHKLYMGISSADLELVSELTENWYMAYNLSPNTKYYWRVDEAQKDGEIKGLTWNFTTALTSALDEKLIKQDLQIYPQPANNYLYISNLKKKTNIEIYDLDGKKLLTEETSGRINISDLNKGTYVLKVTDYNTLLFIK